MSKVPLSTPALTRWSLAATCVESSHCSCMRIVSKCLTSKIPFAGCHLMHQPHLVVSCVPSSKLCRISDTSGPTSTSNCSISCAALTCMTCGCSRMLCECRKLVAQPSRCCYRGCILHCNARQARPGAQAPPGVLDGRRIDQTGAQPTEAAARVCLRHKRPCPVRAR